MTKIFFLIFTILQMFFFQNYLFSQVKIIISPKLNNQDIEFHKDIRFNDRMLKIHNLKFYISNVKLLSNDSVLFAENESYHLLDFTENKNSFHVICNLKSFTQLSFELGVDSVTNENGVKGGDLDPINGMYWAWQSGYINFKLEGQYSNDSKLQVENSKHNTFEYHLGGFLAPNNAIQNVNFKMKEKQSKNANSINLDLNLDNFFNFVINNQIYKIMSPSNNTVNLSKILSESFGVK
jgi:hypothetical protein